MSEIGIKDQCFGVEVEMTGITREQAAHALADYFGTSPQYRSTHRYPVGMKNRMSNPIR